MRTRTIPATVLTAVLLSGCASTTSSSPDSASTPAAPASAAPTADHVFEAIAARVKTAKLTGTVTAASDRNHLLGRPGQYSSKITFSDGRVSSNDASLYRAGDVELGGAVEAFSMPQEAQARADYIRTVAQSLPALAEYDFVHGSVLVRVSRYLTPQQAEDYKRAAETLN
ncbi:hypothetical protein [Streptomyces abikoensis]|uniref:Lipoprotein n=1 Tax=Streptomyces abikoensis TaxID=97398 RepID=A0ABW7TEG3_9ACTN